MDFLFTLLAKTSSFTLASNLTPEMQQALAQLQDIRLPEPIGWWPVAFSWWILLLSVTSILIGIAWYFRDLKRRNAYRKQAQAILSNIMQNPELADNEKIQQMNRLLKQVALTAYGRSRVAALKEQEWVEFLRQNANYIKQPENLIGIFRLGYGPQQTLASELTTCYDYTKKWIKGHHQ